MAYNDASSLHASLETVGVNIESALLAVNRFRPHMLAIDCEPDAPGCLGYPIRDKSMQIFSRRHSTDRMSATPDFRSARRPQRKTER